MVAIPYYTILSVAQQVYIASGKGFIILALKFLVLTKSHFAS